MIGLIGVVAVGSGLLVVQGLTTTKSSGSSATSSSCAAIEKVLTPPEGHSIKVVDLLADLQTIAQRQETANADPSLLPTLQSLIQAYGHFDTSAITTEQAKIDSICS